METFTRLSIQDGVARLLLDRAAKRNALTRQTLEEIIAATGQLTSRRDVRVFVLEAAGSTFCAGMDLVEMQSRAAASDGKTEWRRDSEVYRDALISVFKLPIPTVAAVAGGAVAGGVGLIVACDIAIATQSAFFFLPEPMRGITAAMVAPLLVHRVGAGPATQLLLSGEKWTAADAHRLGLCHDVVADDAIEARVERLARSIMSGSREALAITKRHVQRMSGMEMANLLDESTQISAEARETDDAREGLEAFLQKRKPNWQPD